MNRNGYENIPADLPDLKCEKLTQCSRFNSIGPALAPLTASRAEPCPGRIRWTDGAKANRHKKRNLQTMAAAGVLRHR